MVSGMPQKTGGWGMGAMLSGGPPQDTSSRFILRRSVLLEIPRALAALLRLPPLESSAFLRAARSASSTSTCRRTPLEGPSFLSLGPIRERPNVAVGVGPDEHQARHFARPGKTRLDSVGPNQIASSAPWGNVDDQLAQLIPAANVGSRGLSRWTKAPSPTAAPGEPGVMRRRRSHQAHNYHPQGGQEAHEDLHLPAEEPVLPLGHGEGGEGDQGWDPAASGTAG